MKYYNFDLIDWILMLGTIIGFTTIVAIGQCREVKRVCLDTCMHANPPPAAPCSEICK